MKRNVCVVITARPSYSRIKTALEAIVRHPELELQLVTASSALTCRHGLVSDCIQSDGFSIDYKIENQLEGNGPSVMAKTTGLLILELASFFSNQMPDLVVTIADRYETMATAIAATYMGIPLVHVQGGEVSGNIDGKVRHAITKMADVHLVASKDARDRVIRMGEDPGMVFETGCPSIDLAAVAEGPSDFNPFTPYGVLGNGVARADRYLVVVHHPVTTHPESIKSQTETLLQAVTEAGMPAFWFLPNADAGSECVRSVISDFRDRHPLSEIYFFRNMDSVRFLKLVKHAACLLGNSSVGIRECSYMGVPVVNAGSRQRGRLRAENVVDADYSLESLKLALAAQLAHGPYERSEMYGTVGAGKRIAEVLAAVPLKFHKPVGYQE